MPAGLPVALMLLAQAAAAAPTYGPPPPPAPEPAVAPVKTAEASCKPPNSDPDNREIVICADTADALAALDMPEATRCGIAKAARARVLAEHTGEHRAGELEAYFISAGTRSSDRRIEAELRESVA